MHSETVLQGASRGTQPVAVTQLIVAWQHPTMRAIIPVGLLEQNADGFLFRYGPNVERLEDFRPILGFPQWDGVYRSAHLFPFFSQRVMTPRRPEYDSFMRQLDLGIDAGPMEILGRSRGIRRGDTYQLLPVPIVDPNGTSTYTFLVNGISHVLEVDPSAEETLQELEPGDSLQLHVEPDNPTNERAVIVASDGRQLGWVPNLLLQYVHALMRHGTDGVTVVHVNGKDVDPHMRLLVHAEGSVGVGFNPMTGPEWGPDPWG